MVSMLSWPSMVNLVEKKMAFEDIFLPLEDVWLSFLQSVGVWAKHCKDFRSCPVQSCILIMIHPPPISREWILVKLIFVISEFPFIDKKMEDSSRFESIFQT